MRSSGRAEDPGLVCPKCGTGLSQREVEVLGPNVHVDVCPDCKGMWFDDGELRKVLRDRRVEARMVPIAVGREAGSLECPRCGSTMDLRQAEDVVVDACPGCRGLWLDMGELGSLEAFARAGPQKARVGEGRTLWDEEPYRRREMSFYRLLREVRKG